MKKLYVALALLSAVNVVKAEGYAGAVAALTSIGGGCASGQTDCDKKGFGVRFYAGSKLQKSTEIDFGIGKIDAVEVGVINFGKGISHGSRSVPVQDSSPIDVPTTTVATANAISLVAVGHIPVATDFSAVLRLGGAFVSSTLRNSVGGVQDGSQTATKLKPYAAIGVEYGISSDLRIVGAYDWTKFDAYGQKGNIGALGLGAEMKF